MNKVHSHSRMRKVLAYIKSEMKTNLYKHQNSYINIHLKLLDAKGELNTEDSKKAQLSPSTIV